ncbi:MAG: AraC family transcriptional regulator [Pseudomonadota bacterium]
MSQGFLSTTYARILFRHLQLDERSGEPFFRNTGLTYAALMQLDRHVSWAEQQQLFGNALEIHGRPGLGLSVGTALQIASHGPLGVAAMASADLGSALRVFERFATTRARFVEIRLEDRPDSLRIVFAERIPLGALTEFLTESVVSAMVSAIAFFAGQTPFDGTIRLAYRAPSHAEDYRRHFGVAVQFGAPRTEIVLARPLLDLPSPVADPRLHREALAQCERALEALSEPLPTIASRVERLFEENPGRIWGLDEVASHLHMSSRSLIRKLRREGTRFVELRDRQFERLARDYLREPGLSVAEIGALMGFSDTSSFRRSFKRWTGMTPAAFRAGLAQRSATARRKR